MKHVKLAFCIVMVALVGCIREGAVDCEVVRMVTVRAYDANGVELGAETVREITLWVFDENLHFVETISTSIGTPTAVTSWFGCDIHIVAWGNLMSGNQQVNVGGAHKDSHTVSLVPHSSATGVYTSPNDLFHGKIDLPWRDITGATTRGIVFTEEVTLPVTRAVGSMTITVHGDISRDHNYSMAVKGTASMLDFNGLSIGEAATYHLVGGWKTDAEEYFVPAFNLIPGSGSATVEMYQDNTKILAVNHDKYGTPITTSRDRLTNVLLEIKSGGGGDYTVNIRVSLKPWNVYDLWKEF